MSFRSSFGGGGVQLFSVGCELRRLCDGGDGGNYGSSRYTLCVYL